VVRSSKEYEAIPVEKVFEELKTSPAGLSREEAAGRLKVYGLNAVAEEERGTLEEFLSRFWGPMPWLLELAAALSTLIGRHVEAAIILLLLALNAAVGFRYSRTSRRALELLRSRLAVRAKVVRSGAVELVDAKYLVPGDVILLEIGDVIPADAKLIEGGVLVDQSALTGESLPVEVGAGGVVYAGGHVKRGLARGVVVNTGGNTFFGRTAELVKIAAPRSSQEVVMLQITRYMMLLGLATLSLVTAYAYLAGLKTGLVDLAILAITIMMGAVPVALPAVLTIMQAVAAVKLAREGVLVTKLSAVGDAATVDVACLDKTGTITEGRVKVVDAKPLSGFDGRDVAFYALMATPRESEDPIDRAVVEYASGLSLPSARVLEYRPFDPASKRSESVIEYNGDRVVVTKGAPQVIQQLCRFATEEGKAAFEKAVEEISERGYRCLAVAVSRGRGFEPVGLLALSDPPREDSRDLIKALRRLGIRPKMVTGDNAAIAREVSISVGIGGNVVRIAGLRGLSEEEATRLMEEADCFAEVLPEDKYFIVKTLQRLGHAVCMTGDGVNDAPALRQAELGVAVSNATDVAKASASAVILKPGLGGVVEIIKTGREVHQRAVSWIINKIVKTVQFVLLAGIGLVWLGRDVLTPIGMALLLVANDFLTMSLATDNTLPSRNPSRWMIKDLLASSLAIGLVFVAHGLLGLYIAVNWIGVGGEGVGTFTLLLLAYTSQFRVLMVRERGPLWKTRPGRELALSTLLTTAAFTILGTAGGVVEPLNPLQVALSLAYSATVLLADPLKQMVFRWRGLALAKQFRVL